MLLHGGHPQRNSATERVIQYLERKRLADLGFTSDLGSITAEQADTLLIIDSEWNKWERERIERERASAARR